MTEVAQVTGGPWSGIHERYWRAYFGRNADYYIAQLRRVQEGHWPAVNWSAFFFGMGWMLYRRMYLLGFCAFMVTLAYSSLEQFLLWFLDASGPVQRGVERAGLLLTSVLVGTLANRIYLWDARRQIRMELDRKAVQVEEVLLENIRKRGGTGWLFLVILLVAVVLVLIVANALDLMASF